MVSTFCSCHHLHSQAIAFITLCIALNRLRAACESNLVHVSQHFHTHSCAIAVILSVIPSVIRAALNIRLFALSINALLRTKKHCLLSSSHILHKLRSKSRRLVALGYICARTSCLGTRDLARVCVQTGLHVFSFYTRSYARRRMRYKSLVTAHDL